MRQSIIIAASILIMAACGAARKSVRERHLVRGGPAYCEAHRAKDAGRMKSIARTHYLAAGDWDRFCGLMEKQEYLTAFSVAEEKKLGPWALRKAGFAYSSQLIEDDSVFIAYMTVEKLGLSKEGTRAFAETMYALMQRKGECVIALEVATTFGLPDYPFAADSLECIETKHGTAAALAYACLKSAPEPSLSRYKKGFLANLPRWYTQAGRETDFSDAVTRCEWNRGDLEGLLIFLRKVPDPKLAAYVLGKLEPYLPEKEIYAIAVSLFDQGLAASDAERAGLILKSWPKALDDTRRKALVKAYIAKRECAEALALTHTLKLDDATIDAVFTDPMCVVSSFDTFETDLYYADDGAWLKYFTFALKHDHFHLARRLADRAQKARKDDKDSHELLIAKGLDAGAHALLLSLAPPPGEEAETYREGIFEHALDHGREWTAATFANQYATTPPAIVERAYLRAMERGEWILAAQIAEKYGDPKKLESRARLAFEMAMIAEKPKDAQFIMRVTRLKDPELTRRAALMRFRQKREEERKAAQEKRRRERAKRRRERRRREEAGEWSVTRD